MGRIAKAWTAVFITVATLGITTPVSAVPKPGISISHDVTTVVQTRLASFGYTVRIDGIYGPQTTAAVKAWQRVNGLVVDGIAGRVTIASLDNAAASQGAVATAPARRVNPPTPQPVFRGDTEQIIRDIWPDDIEDWAVRIAKRESGPHLLVTAHNACCYGIFQIHFQAHRAWLGDFGVNTPSDLYDPAVNATVALALYMASNPHCQPWGC